MQAEKGVTSAKDARYYLGKETESRALEGAVDVAKIKPSLTSNDIDRQQYRIKYAIGAINGEDGLSLLQNAAKRYGEDTSNWEAYAYMTDDEKKTLKYYAGNGDYASANAYLDGIERKLTARRSETETKKLEKSAYDNTLYAFAENLYSTIGSVAGYFHTLDTTIKNKAGKDYEPIDINDAVYSAARNQSVTGKAIAQRAYDVAYSVTKSERVADIAEWSANTGLSIAQNYVRNMIALATGNPAIALGWMAADVAGRSTYDALTSGSTNEQALAFATITAAVEVVTEKIGLDNLFEITKTSGKAMGREAIKEALKAAAGQMAAEASEEMIAEVVDNVGDMLITGATDP